MLADRVMAGPDPELYPQVHLGTVDAGSAYHVVAGEGPPPTTSSCGTHPEPHRSAAGRGPEWCLRHDEVVGGGPAPATTLYARPPPHPAERGHDRDCPMQAYG